MATQKVIVTGATGFIGKHLTRRLVHVGAEVRAVVRPGSENKLPIGISPIVVESDEHLRAEVDRFRPDVAFHLASLFIAEHTAMQVAGLIESNLLFSTQFVEACARAGCKRFINTGTSWQHYRSTGYDPVCLYAATKEAFDAILDYYADAFGISVITLKLADSYGPADERRKLVRIIIEAVASGQPVDMSPGEQEIDLVHVCDIVDALIAAAKRSEFDEQGRREKFAVRSGRPLTVRALATMVVEIMGGVAKLNWGGRSYRAREVMQSWRGGELLPGWTPAISLESGLRALVEEFNDQGRS